MEVVHPQLAIAAVMRRVRPEMFRSVTATVLGASATSSPMSSVAGSKAMTGAAGAGARVRVGRNPRATMTAPAAIPASETAIKSGRAVGPGRRIIIERVSSRHASSTTFHFRVAPTYRIHGADLRPTRYR